MINNFTWNAVHKCLTFSKLWAQNITDPKMHCYLIYNHWSNNDASKQRIYNWKRARRAAGEKFITNSREHWGCTDQKKHFLKRWGILVRVLQVFLSARLWWNTSAMRLCSLNTIFHGEESELLGETVIPGLKQEVYQILHWRAKKLLKANGVMFEGFRSQLEVCYRPKMGQLRHQ